MRDDDDDGPEKSLANTRVSLSRNEIQKLIYFATLLDSRDFSFLKDIVDDRRDCWFLFFFFLILAQDTSRIAPLPFN